ncbi:MAG: tetratricopeptide repeat protein [Lewinellaceae bacterium]|nr:tetratricopeptide repeat protein [Lewinellaceae bacterium]
MKQAWIFLMLCLSSPFNSSFAQLPADTLAAGQLNIRADALLKSDSAQAAMYLIQESMAAYTTAGMERSRGYAWAKMQEGKALILLKRPEEAITACKSSAGICRDLGPSSDTLLASAYLYRAWGFQDQYECDSAWVYNQRCADIRRRLLGDRDAAVAEPYNNQCVCLQGIGRFKEALDICEQCTGIRAVAGNNDTLAWAKSLSNHGSLYYYLGTPAKGIPFLRKAGNFACAK